MAESERFYGADWLLTVACSRSSASLQQRTDNREKRQRDRDRANRGEMQGGHHARAAAVSLPTAAGTRSARSQKDYGCSRGGGPREPPEGAPKPQPGDGEIWQLLRWSINTTMLLKALANLTASAAAARKAAVEANGEEDRA